MTEDKNEEFVEEFRKQFAVKHISKVREESKMEIDWLVNGLIEQNSLTQIYSDWGIGKSWVALDLADSISKGRKFMNEFPCKRSKVLYLDYENGEFEIGRRHMRLTREPGEHLDISFEPIHFDDFIDKGNQEAFGFTEILKAEGYEVIIIDTFRDSFTGDENSSSDIGKVNRALKKLKDMGLSVIVLHHTIKSDPRTSRGSSAINAKFDNIFSLTDENNARSQLALENPKRRRGAKYPKILFRIYHDDVTNTSELIFGETAPQGLERRNIILSALMEFIKAGPRKWSELEAHAKGLDVFKSDAFNKAIKDLKEDKVRIDYNEQSGLYSWKRDAIDGMLSTPGDPD